MKRLFTLIIMAACLCMAGCGDTSSSVPSAIRSRITQYSNVIQRVDECQYHSNTVHFFCGRSDISGSKDYLFSANGTLMATFGGFGSPGNGNCADFYETAHVVRVVWANGRYVD